MKVKITHGKGPVSALVGKGETVEVELTPEIQAAVDAGLIVVVGKVSRETSKKPAKPVVGTITATDPETGERSHPGGSEGSL